MTSFAFVRRSTPFLVLAALAAACSGKTDIGSGSGAVTGGECSEDGAQTFAEDGCNTCSCEDGAWACTEMACEAECSDGEMRFDGCNTCSCDDGEWLCTRKACDVCEDGATQPSPDGCNTCSCLDGQWACTLRACAPEPMCPAPTRVPPDVGCVEVEVYARDPVTSACCHYGTPCQAPEGWMHFYSEAECNGGDPPVEPECVPGQMRLADDGCNTCVCAADGAGWACTEKACPPEEPVGCGGWLGDTCSDDEYCAYEEGQYCGAADASSVCKPRPQACDAVYDPVCGCDGETYSSACEAAMKGTGVLESGECTGSF